MSTTTTPTGDAVTSTRSATVKNILSGLLDIQDKLHVIRAKTGQVGNQKYKYADLGAVWDACRALLKEKGMIIVHDSPPAPDATSVVVRATLHHVESEEWMSSTILIRPRAMTPQEIGSAQTYGRRYTLQALVGIVTDEDDDGKAASKTPASNMKELKSKLRAFFAQYQGEDREELREAATAAQNDGKFDVEFIRGIEKKTGAKILDA